MNLYTLLAGGLKPIDYILIVGAIVVTVVLVVIILWRKAKGKSGCGCDCGSCKNCPSAQACKGNCGGCTAREDQEENVEE